MFINSLYSAMSSAERALIKACAAATPRCDGVRRQGGIRTIRPLQAQRPKRVAVTKQRAELHVDELDRLVVPLCQPKKRPFS